ncbi:unnamed protein product [Pseudo-nitzschia multistriata]|uniref:Uncharacterized protein n=1 Tax=Pseudo-nitzschia multistriata TaxID=183589 RepID=A0A448Z6M3_9STRA|nr:unnamed protein product [Pseudo-nitzschia multistriata]
MRQTQEKLQHRRHRPMYLAPSAVVLQQFSSGSNDSSDNVGFDCGDDRDNDGCIDDLRIPLFVKIPMDDRFRMPILSPPSSNGSRANNESVPTSSTSIPEQQPQPWAFPPTPPQHQGHHEPSFSSTRIGPFSERFIRFFTALYYLVSDFITLILVCVVGLFFDVKVQVVNHRSHRRRGRISLRNNLYRAEDRRYNSSDLLRPLPPEMDERPLLMEDDMV